MDERIGPNGVRPLQLMTTTAGMVNGKRERFLEELALSCNVHRAAAAAGVAVSTAYRLRNRDAGFAAEWRDALSNGYDRLEQMLLTRALNGMGDGSGPDLRSAGPTPEDGPAVEAGTETGSDEKAEAGPAAGRKPRPGVRLERFAGVPADLQLAMWLLNRHQATVERREKRPAARRPATAEETDAAIEHKLAMLAKYRDRDA